MKFIKKMVCLAAALAAAMTSSCGKKADKADDSGALTVTFIDVGKGDCILAESGGSTLMIDTGYAETAQSVLEHLSQNGIEKLDVLIITHYDKDHVGGAADIVGEIPVSRIFLPGYKGSGSEYKALKNAVGEKGISAETVSEDISFSLGGTDFSIFASDISYEKGNDNDVSLVVSAVHGNDSYLFAADVEKKGINSLLDKLERGYDVLKMPHHGRKESNTDKLVEAVGAKIAVITDSEDESADKKVLTLLDEAETEVYRSALSGDITIESVGGGEYSVITEK